MGLFHWGVPPWLTSWTITSTEIRLAVETGTYRGDSADLLARALGRCITVERDEELGAAAEARFRDRPDVSVRIGSSRVLLPQICGSLKEPALFWLDGHWSGVGTAGADDPCPVLAEVDAIANSRSPRSNVVAIDDLRLFGFGHKLDPRMDHFPRLFDVLGRLEGMGLTTFGLDDVIVGVPQSFALSFLSLTDSPDVRQRTLLFRIWEEIEEAWVLSRRAFRAEGP